MGMQILHSYLISVFLISGCGNYNKGNFRLARQSAQANGFLIEKSLKNAGVTKLTIFNPWEEARDVSVDYYLVNRDSEISASLAGTPRRTPCARSTGSTSPRAD